MSQKQGFDEQAWDATLVSNEPNTKKTVTILHTVIIYAVLLMLLTQILHNSQYNSALNQKYILSLNGYFLFAFFHSFCGGIPQSVFAAVCKLCAIIMVSLDLH